MPYQSSQSYTTSSVDQNSARYYNNSSLLSTQPTSNVSQFPPYTRTTTTNPSTLVSPSNTNNSSISDFNDLYSCRHILASHQLSTTSDKDYFKLLYCMYTGCEGNARSRIMALLDHKHSTLTIRSIKPVKKDYVAELNRRYSYLKLKEKGVLVWGNKSFRPRNKSQEELNNLFNSPQFRLPSGEKLYLEFEMELFISNHEKELATRLDELQQLGSEISKSDLKKMRLWEAIFLDTKYMRDKLVNLKNGMNRQEIDARTSNVHPLSLFQLAAEKYNDPNWVVYSRIMPDLNEKFRKPIKLSLMADEEPITEAHVKNAYTDAKGKMNVSLANWKTSGNGKGNLNTKIKGLGYENSSDDTQMTYVDDDRFNFVSNLHIAYFWSLCECNGLTHHISQNCSALNAGQENGSDRSASASTSGKARGRTSSTSIIGKKEKAELQTEALFSMVDDIKQNFLQQTKHFEQSHLTTQVIEAEESLISL
jgi:hypothetical protein